MPNNEDDDIDLDAARTDMELEEQDKRVRQLVDAGAVWNPDTKTYTLDGKHFGEDGNLL